MIYIIWIVIPFKKLTKRQKPLQGGVGLFFNENIQFCKRTDLYHLDDYMEYVITEIENKSFNMDIKFKFKLLIGIISKATSFTNV